MDLLNTLKKLKNIEADNGYTEKSRSLILNTRHKKEFNIWSLMLRNLELGVTFALAGVLILLILGSFSPWKSMAPLQMSNLDPAGLKAEANAIDIQIQLMNLNYAGTVGAKSAESTIQSSPATLQTNPAEPAQGGSANAAPSNASTSNTISIDEALLKLSE